MTEEEIKLITPEKHLGCVAQGQQLAALMKKRKEEILRNKEQSTEQSTEQSSVQSTEQPSVQSNNTYVYGVDIIAVLVIGACVFFAYNTLLRNRTTVNEKRINHQNDVICFRKKIQ